MDRPRSENRPSWLAQRLTSARDDAARIARELEQRGHLSAAQAAALESAVESAVTRGGELLEDALREPRRILATLRQTGRAAGSSVDAEAGEAAGSSVEAEDGAPDLAARVRELEARVALLEGLVVSRGATEPKDREADA